MIKQLNRTKPKLSSCHVPMGEGEGLAKAEMQISFLGASSAAVEWKGSHPEACQLATETRDTPGEYCQRPHDIPVPLPPSLDTEAFQNPFCITSVLERQHSHAPFTKGDGEQSAVCFQS